MDDKTTKNFGLLVAYVVPGFIVLVGLSFVSQPVAGWLIGAGQAGPTVGSFLYVALASITAGMTASAVRWAVVDTVHQRTGLARPNLDESRLADRLEAFNYLVENHYRYYQFYSNTCVAIVFAYACWRLTQGTDRTHLGWPEITLLFVVPVLFAGSRDALRKYYAGGRMLLGTLEKDSTNDQRKAPQHVSAKAVGPAGPLKAHPDQEGTRSGRKERAEQLAYPQSPEPIDLPDTE